MGNGFVRAGGRVVSVGMAYVFALTTTVQTGCGGEAGVTGGAPGIGGTGDPRPSLHEYSSAAQQLADSMDEVVRGVGALDSALAAADDAAVDAALDAQPAALAAVEDALERLRTAEEALDGSAFGDQPEVVAQSLAFLPVLATLAGFASFITYLRGQNAAANEARSRRDAALDGIDQNVAGATDDYRNAQNDLNDVGADVIRRTTTEVVTSLVLSPADPTSVGGIIVKEAAGQALQEGITVLTSTPGCKAEPVATDCRVGATRTGADGQARAPAGTLTISISGNGIARTQLEDVELDAGETLEIVLDLIDIDDLDEPGAGAGGAGGVSGTSGTSGTGGTGGTSAGGSGSSGPCRHPDAVGTDVPVQVDVESQADLDALVGCTSVGGLEVPFGTTGITSLAGLESLTEIRMVEDPVLGDLDIFSGQLDLSGVVQGVEELTDISALSNLRRVEGSVSINLASVRSIDLRSLQTVGDPRASLSGLTIGGDLVGLIDLSSLERVVGDVHFTAQDLDSLLLTRLATIEADGSGYGGGFTLSDADRLATLELPALTRIAGDLWIYWSDGITSIQAPLLSEVRVDVRIEDNTVLSSIGLDSITQPTGGLSISQNNALTSIGLNGLPSVASVADGTGHGNVRIERNALLTTIGLAALRSIGGSLSLSGNDMLPSESAQALRDRVTIGTP